MGERAFLLFELYVLCLWAGCCLWAAILVKTHEVVRAKSTGEHGIRWNRQWQNICGRDLLIKTSQGLTGSVDVIPAACCLRIVNLVLGKKNMPELCAELGHLLWTSLLSLKQRSEHWRYLPGWLQQQPGAYCLSWSMQRHTLPLSPFIFSI